MGAKRLFQRNKVFFWGWETGGIWVPISEQRDFQEGLSGGKGIVLYSMHDLSGPVGGTGPGCYWNDFAVSEVSEFCGGGAAAGVEGAAVGFPF